MYNTCMIHHQVIIHLEIMYIHYKALIYICGKTLSFAIFNNPQIAMFWTFQVAKGHQIGARSGFSRMGDQHQLVTTLTVRMLAVQHSELLFKGNIPQQQNGNSYVFREFNFGGCKLNKASTHSGTSRDGFFEIRNATFSFKSCFCTLFFFLLGIFSKKKQRQRKGCLGIQTCRP